MTAINARLWIDHHGSPVKLTLRPGETVAVWEGGPDEEGWHSDSQVIEHDGEVVLRTSTSDGRDCDGRLTERFFTVCPVDRLRAGPPWLVRTVGFEEVRDSAVPMPAWETDRPSERRDEYAEAAGY